MFSIPARLIATMIARGYFILTILVNRVLSLPVTPTYLEKEDVEVMKCIVEVLADVLSRPHPLPVSQECLNILKTDERLVSILRHSNFLKELQDIAVQGANERAQQHGDVTADHVTKKPQGPQGIDEAADRSMLAALGGPGERSILSQKRGTGGEREGEGEGEGEGEVEKSTEREGESSRERNEIIRKGEEKNREKDETPDNRISDVMNKEGKEEVKYGYVIEKKEEEEEEGDEKEKEEDEEERASSEDNTEEAKTEGRNVTLDKKGAESGEVTDAPEEKSEEKKSAEEKEEEVVEEKSSALPLQDSAEAKKVWEEEEEEEEGEVKRKAVSNHWSRMSELARSLQTKKRAGEEEKVQEVKLLEVGGQQEVPHHSKEVVEEEVEEKRKVGGARRSPEVKELQMMARRKPEERREEGEEEGSASRKTEDPEIESLAAIESELESVAQKLHELRRG
ncbi:chromogranin-A [Coregonus clupeaformis]|uniref:chromogranin-A n=1 Tax=Coregonus clupeaformis TaxID=59861 RepID=UPI001BE0D384|nr:chromogranin-A [Coregonus clupeaformis]